MAKKKLSKCEAKSLARKMGWDFKKDFHAQGTAGEKAELAALAKLAGYRKPKNASGSTSLYFFEHLKKQKNCKP